MPPAPMNRFPPGQNPSGYHQQFPGHGQHSGQNHPTQLPPNYNLHPNQQPNPFSNTLLNLPGAGGFNLGADQGLASHAARMGFAQAGNQQLSQQQAAIQQVQQHIGQQLQQVQQQVGQQQHQPHHQHQQHPQHASSAHHPQQHLQHGQQQQNQHALVDHLPRGMHRGRIRDVWKHNLEEEMAVVRDLIDKFPYVAMDTEFPGVVARPMGRFLGKNDYHYQCLRANVDMLKLIQIGITLFNEHGELPAMKVASAEGGGRRGGNQGSQLPHAWQFNFKFSLKDDMYNQTSIESLQQAGIDFNVLERDGICPREFASLLFPSGLVCFQEVHWISFHGGYDFGYLTKLLACQQLPDDEVDFDFLMKLHFPSTYDVKHILKHAVKLQNSGMLQSNDPSVADILTKFEQKSGLEHIAEALKLKRTGVAHQAGSDSLITGRVFFELRKRIFSDKIPDEHLGKIWGLGIPDYSVAGAGITVSAGNNANNNNNNNTNANTGAAGTGTENAPSPQNGAGNNSVHQQNGGAPSTPNTNPAGLANTPAAGSHNTNGGGGGGGNAGNLGGMGPMTPGGGGGVFGAFAFGGGNR